MALPVIRDMVLLQPGAGRQKNVSQLCCGCQEKVDDSQEIKLI
jgi:hypothetical protein